MKNGIVILALVAFLVSYLAMSAALDRTCHRKGGVYLPREGVCLPLRGEVGLSDQP